MASLIRGVTVTLYERTQTGEDAFGAPVYDETAAPVDNVLVCPAASEAVVGGLNLYGKRAEYELCIPKGDDHVWEDRRVDFFGRSFRTFGFVSEYIDDMVPLDWNGKIKVERYE